MTAIHVRGFKIFPDKKPPFKQRCYRRATGHKIHLEKAPLGSAVFFAEYERIRALAEAMRAKDPKAGTLGGLIAVTTTRSTSATHFRIGRERIIGRSLITSHQ